MLAYAGWARAQEHTRRDGSRSRPGACEENSRGTTPFTPFNDDRYLTAADRVFELAKRASSLWKKQPPQEKRKLLELVVSNPQLEGSRVRYELKKPFAILSEMAKGLDWRARVENFWTGCRAAA